MAVFNHVQKEINAKIVYCGPGVSGKTTNLQFIYQNMKAEQRGKIVSLATNEERTLFFDFLPIELDSIRGFKTRFHLYTVPGQVYYGATRRAVLLGVDGVIFVADSQADKMEDNLISLKDLEENLSYYGKRIETFPLIIQYNKRDLPNILTLEELNQKINRLNVPYFEAVAVQGKGVFDTLTLICRTVLKGVETGAGVERKYVGKPETPTVKLTFAEPPPPLQEPHRAKETGRPGIIRQKPDKLKPEAGGQANEKTRIVSCGEPRILPPHSIQIPLTMEIDGSAKSFSVNLAIDIKELTKETA
jgi:signal recognition particle receptor subunit beta